MYEPIVRLTIKHSCVAHFYTKTLFNNLRRVAAMKTEPRTERGKSSLIVFLPLVTQKNYTAALLLHNL